MSAELIGHHEILLPLLHLAVACRLAGHGSPEVRHPQAA